MCQVGTAPGRALLLVPLVVVALACVRKLETPPEPPPEPPPSPSDGGSLGPNPTVVIPEMRRPDAAGSQAPPPVGSPSPPPPTGPFTPRPSPMSVALYDENKVVDIYLTFPPGEFERLKAPPAPTVPVTLPDPRWVRCGITFEGQTNADAHCRRKGEPTSWPLEGKPQMIVRFNLINKQGRFRGLRRLNLERFDGHAAPIRDRLGMWMMREAGLDAPRVNNARVFKDGQLLGVYLNVEAVDKEFLEDHFGPEGLGNLWESFDELKTNEDMRNETRLFDLDDMILTEPLTGDHTAFFRKLDEMMDIDQVLRLMAAETAMLTDDNFSNGSDNFYLYDHPSRGFMIIPWDLDTILTGDTATADASPWEFWGTSPPNKLRQLMNQNQAWRAKFVDYVVEYRDRLLTHLPDRVDYICDQIGPAVAADPTATSAVEDFGTDCASIKVRADERAAALRRLLKR
jgi:hypothetical protein